MRAILGVAAAVIALSAGPGKADDCQDRFVGLLVGGNPDGPVKIHVTQEVKGAATTKNYFYQAEAGHWMTEMIDPADAVWVLTYDNVMYTSSDKGKTWTKLRTLDSDQNATDAKANLAENAKTARNAVCGEEDLDGAMHDVVEADYTNLQGFWTENHHKYWVNRDTGIIVKATYAMKGEGFESFTTQLIAPAPDLTLPTPE